MQAFILPKQLKNSRLKSSFYVCFAMTLQQSPLPSKEQIQLLPRFKNLPAQCIHVVATLEQCLAVEPELKKISIFGFDSESKPTFTVGEISTGPHLIQLASLENAYLFQMNTDTWHFLAKILADAKILKVGFGLKNDRILFQRKGIELAGVVELAKAFSGFGIQHTMGVKNAMALLFQVNFPKSKKISTSNWSKKILSPEQIAYAAADAYAARLIYQQLQRLHSN